MNDPGMQQKETEFERNARAMFDASTESLDEWTLAKLRQARKQALEQAKVGQASAVGRAARHRPRTYWMPAAALAASVLGVALLLRGPLTEPTTEPVAAAPIAPVEAMELLAAGEDLEIAAEADLDFYAWVEAVAAPAANGVGG
jgi:hypothetical protein